MQIGLAASMHAGMPDSMHAGMPDSMHAGMAASMHAPNAGMPPSAEEDLMMYPVLKLFECRPIRALFT